MGNQQIMVQVPAGARDFTLFHNHSDTKPLYYSVGNWRSFLMTEQPGHEDQCSSRSSIDVKMG